MSIICNVDLSTALKYRGKSLSTKVGSKKHKVYLKLLCDDFTLSECVELASQSKNILMVSYQGMETAPAYLNMKDNQGVYIGHVVDVGSDVSSSDIERLIEETPECVVPIANLPASFKNLALLWRLSMEFPRVRFCGGQLFAIDGVKVGEIGVDILQRADVKFGADSYRLRSGIDALENMNIDGLEIDTTGKETRSSTPRQHSVGGTPKPKKLSLKEQIGNLLMGDDLGGDDW